MKIIAQLADADTTLSVAQDGRRFHVSATRSDGVNSAVIAHDSVHGTLAGAIKATMLFYVGEWESVFHEGQLVQKMGDAITAM